MNVRISVKPIDASLSRLSYIREVTEVKSSETSECSEYPCQLSLAIPPRRYPVYSEKGNGHTRDHLSIALSVCLSDLIYKVGQNGPIFEQCI